MRNSTQPYSASGFGPGYGYLWWTGPLDSPFGPVVRVPAGTFFAQGVQAQYALVLPAYDMVIVHRVDSDTSRADPNLRQVGRLVWLILKAAGMDGIGPDTTVEAAPGDRLLGEALAHTVSGAMLIFAGTTGDGRNWGKSPGKDEPPSNLYH